jgi:hypothetical protein
VNVDRILDVIDVGLQQDAGTDWAASLGESDLCVRCQRHEPSEGDLCGGCRAFLLEDSDEDPAFVRWNQPWGYVETDIVFDEVTWHSESYEWLWDPFMEAATAAAESLAASLRQVARVMTSTHSWCHFIVDEASISATFPRWEPTNQQRVARSQPAVDDALRVLPDPIRVERWMSTPVVHELGPVSGLPAVVDLVEHRPWLPQRGDR